MDGFTFRQAQYFPQPPEELFPFFASAENLNRITPPWLHFSITSDLPRVIEEGSLIDYALRLHGFPVKWRSRISDWRPPYEFTDSQLRGPFRKWVHHHQLIRQDNGTLMVDTVDYEVPGGPLAPLVNKLYVSRDVSRIFAYRRQVLSTIFGGS